MMNTDPTMESLVSICANDENFYGVISSVQSLYNYLKENQSSRCEEEYTRLLAYLIENYLDEKKKLFLRRYLGERVGMKMEDEHAAKYFKKRLRKAEMIEVLKQHYQLTGKRLIITSVDYDQQKFKVKTA